MPDYKKLVGKKTSSKRPNRVSAKPRKPYRALTYFLIFGLLIVGACLALRSLLLNFSGFKISKVSVVNAKGRPVQNPESIFRLEDYLEGEISLFKFNMKRAAQDIAARHPEIASIVIRKQFPNALLIIIKPKVPVAIVEMQRTCLVDEEGFVLPFESSYASLPKIVGIHPKQIQLYTQTHSLRLKKALELLKELKEAEVFPQYKVSQIDVRQYSEVVFYFENGTEVKIGQGDFARKAALLKGILAQLKEDDTVPKYIDMRFDSPAVLP